MPLIRPLDINQIHQQNAPWLARKFTCGPSIPQKKLDLRVVRKSTTSPLPGYHMNTKYIIILG